MRLKASNCLRQRSGAVRGLLNLRDILARLPAAGIQKQIRMAANHHQQIIEIVRDAARQLPHRFHFLRLAELHLQHFRFGHVGHHALQRFNAIRVAHHRRDIGEPVILSVARLQAVFRRIGLPRRAAFFFQPYHFFNVFRMQPLEPKIRVGHPFRGREIRGSLRFAG